jgi:hypothetical protein
MKKLRLSASVGLLLFVSSWGFYAAREAHAGWRELGLVVVPMHAKDDASARSCYTKLRKQLTGKEGSDIVHVRQSRENLARKLGDETMASWTTAAADAFKPLENWEPTTWRGPDGKTVGTGYVVDAWVLIDCHPDELTLDVVSLVPSTGSVTRLRVGGKAIDASTRSIAQKVVLTHAWADWVP